MVFGLRSGVIVKISICCFYPYNAGLLALQRRRCSRGGGRLRVHAIPACLSPNSRPGHGEAFSGQLTSGLLYALDPFVLSLSMELGPAGQGSLTVAARIRDAAAAHELEPLARQRRQPAPGPLLLLRPVIDPLRFSVMLWLNARAQMTVPRAPVSKACACHV